MGVMESNCFDANLRELVAQGGTVVALRSQMEDLGFDMSSYSAMSLLKKVIPIVTELRAAEKTKE